MRRTKDPLAVAIDLAREVSRLTTRLGRHVEIALAPLDLSVPQYRVMCVLAEGSTASSTVANNLAVRPPSVTSVVDGLVARELVRRELDPHDRRRLPLTLTEGGRRVLAEADAAVAAQIELVVRHLGQSTPAALRALEQWNEALDRYRDEKAKQPA